MTGQNLWQDGDFPLVLKVVDRRVNKPIRKKLVGKWWPMKATSRGSHMILNFMYKNFQTFCKLVLNFDFNFPYKILKQKS